MKRLLQNRLSKKYTHTHTMLTKTQTNKQNAHAPAKFQFFLLVMLSVAAFFVPILLVQGCIRQDTVLIRGLHHINAVQLDIQRQDKDSRHVHRTENERILSTGALTQCDKPRKSVSISLFIFICLFVPSYRPVTEKQTMRAMPNFSSAISMHLSMSCAPSSKLLTSTENGFSLLSIPPNTLGS